MHAWGYLKFAGSGAGAAEIVYCAKVRVGSFCKREKVGHLECFPENFTIKI